MSGYDQWLGSYERHPTEAWCVNPECAAHSNGVTVTFEREFGQGWLTPEECPLCGGVLTLDQPKGEDDDEGDARV